MSKKIRIGIVGAGSIWRDRHFPGFQQLSDVQVTAVSNSCPKSTKAAADEFGIPNRFDSWQELVASEDVDAVVVGTWPDLHCEITCAALEAGKHVLTQARMARNLAEARTMLEASQRHPETIAQLVPSPFGLQCGPVLENLLKDHFLGDLREVVVIGATDQFWDYSKEMHPRQCAEKSGHNALALGILHETLCRWVPDPVQVFAQTEIFEPTRPNLSDNSFTEVTVPDSVQVLTELKGGARAVYHLSGVILFGPGTHIHMYGSRGTVKVSFENGKETVFAGRANDKALSELKIPAEDLGKWQVEEQFVAAIQGKRKVDLNSFKDGIRYMEFVEAVARSAELNAPVNLPLA